jgi:hypothetical protein
VLDPVAGQGWFAWNARRATGFRRMRPFCVPFATLAELRTMAGSRAIAEGGLSVANRVALGTGLVARFGALLRPGADGRHDHQ